MSHSKPLIAKGKFIDLIDLQYKLTGKFSLPKGGAKGPGLTYIPACNANITNSTQPKLFTGAAKAEAAKLPASFSWSNDADVGKYKSQDLVGIIMPPQNQLSCGSCWAFATSTSLSDRVAIVQKANPSLGPTYLMSYGLSIESPALGGCNGGGIQDALQAMTKAPAGTVPNTCWGYDWCANDTNCSSGGDEDQANSVVPKFDSKTCLGGKKPIPNIYHVLPNSVAGIGAGPTGNAPTQRELNETFAQMRQHIFDKGPMPTGFFVYADFFLGTAAGADGWGTTGGVYVHLEVDPTTGKSVKGDPFPYTYGCDKDKAGCLAAMQTQAGAHAVSIVGWGVADVPNFLPVSHKGKKTLSIPYWVVRNSWGTTWNEGGYFRIACTNSEYGINTEIKLDDSHAGVGGPIDFDAGVSGGPVSKSFAATHPSLETHPSLKQGLPWIIIAIVLIVVGVAAFCAYKKLKK